MLAFEKGEYQERVKRVKESMEKQGIEVLLITDPSNMNYVSGYDAMSYYVPQRVVVATNLEEPVCIVRLQDLYCVTETTWMLEENVIAYSDKYLWKPKVLHVMDFIGDFLKEKGLQNKKIGLELDVYYFNAHWYKKLEKSLPNAEIKDATDLVNWIRGQAKVVVEGLNVALSTVKPGVTCEAVEKAWQTTINKYGLEKESRMGYTVGLSYPPVWTENTAYFKPGEKTVLKPNMTFHMMPGMWLDG